MIPEALSPTEPTTAAVRSDGPVGDAERQPLIDILRGVALLGILLINIPGFAMPQYFSEAFRSNPKDVNFWIYAFIRIFWEGKMRALFGMVFGAGVLLFTARKEALGRPVTGLFYRRMFWLLLFGLIHAHVLLWEGDILFYYAICGMIVFLFRNVRARRLVWWVPLVALLDFGVYNFYYGQIRAQHIAYGEAVRVRDAGGELTPGHAAALTEWREVEKSIVPNREDVADRTRKMQGNYRSVASAVRPSALDFETKYLGLSIPDSVALMLFGMALLKWGFLGGRWSRRTYWRLVALGYGVGLPLVVFSYHHATVHSPTIEAGLAYMDTQPVPWVHLIYPFQRILLVMAHASLIILAVQGGWLRGLTRRFAAVGQIAFTNDITHTIICSLVFFGYGLGRFGDMPYYQIYVLAVGIWILQLLASPWWLTRFHFGPLEWLWRSLTYWKLQPFAKARP